MGSAVLETILLIQFYLYRGGAGTPKTPSLCLSGEAIPDEDQCIATASPDLVDVKGSSLLPSWHARQHFSSLRGVNQAAI